MDRNKHMMKYILIVVFMYQFAIKAQPPTKNAVIIFMEGLSRSTLYPLLSKNRLPNLNDVIERGNYRNNEAEGVSLNNGEAMLSLLTGKDHHDMAISTANFNLSETFVKKIADAYPSVNIKVLLAISAYESSENESFLLQKSLTHYAPNNSFVQGSSYDIGSSAAKFINTSNNPFLLVIKYSNIEHIGQKYREGGELYSMAVENCDRSIGLIIAELKKKKQWQHTEFLITTSVGMIPKSKFRSPYTWVIATQKVRRKGSIQDIVPSIYDLLGLKDKMNQHELAGESLF